MKRQFCTYCFEDTECKYEEKMVFKVIDKKKVKFLEKYYICSKCNNKIYGDMLDYNTSAVNEELRKMADIITKNEIEDVLSKYSISQKNLSKVLGFGEIQISRYLKSGNPSKEHSDKLKEIKDNPFIFEVYLMESKGCIDDKAFKKALSKVRQLELTNEHSKLYNIGTYIIDKNAGMDNMSLQKVLYFINGFSKKLLNKKLFNDEAQAWLYGPVYAELYDAFVPVTRDPIEASKILKDREFDLTEEEKEYIDKISIYFSCYSGSKLRNMSHLTDPWIKARKGLTDDDYSNRIIDEKDVDEYFDRIIEEYNINNYEDVKKYSESLFNKTFENKNK